MLIKKFVSLIIALSTFIGCVSYAWEPVANDNSENVKEFLNVLNIIDVVTNKGYKDNDLLTRGELADIVMRLSGRYESAAYSDIFGDVTEDTQYASSITTLTAMGVIAEAQNFYPDEPALYEHAVKMIVYLLGYNALAEYEGGWISPIFRIANNIGLTKGINASIGQQVDAAMISALAFNALDCTVMERTLSNDFKTDNDKTLLTEYFDIYKIKGIVSANNITSLTRGVTMVNEAVINNITYSDEGGIAQNLLGMEVIAYYTEDDSEIVYAYPTSKNNVLTVKATEIEKDAAGFGYTDFYYTESEKDKTQRVKIKSGADVIYNGRAYPEFTDDTFKIQSGNIRFVDNDNDGVADVVFVNESETYVVGTVNIQEQQIYDIYGKILMLEEVDFLRISDMYGGKMDLNQLTEWNVLSVMQSKDGEVVEIVSYNDPVMGDVRAVWTEDGESYVNVDGDVFAIAPSYLKALADKNSKAKEIVIGQSGTYYLDNDERIAAVVLDESNSWRYGFIINTYIDDATECLRFKIICDNSGAAFYDAAKSLRIDGYVREGIKAYNAMCLDVNGDNTGEPVPQLVKFMMNGQGLVSRIDTAAKTEKETTENLDKVVSKKSEYWSSRTGRLGIDESVGIMLNTNSTIIFRVPESDIYNEEKYSMQAGYITNNEIITYDAYDVDFAGTAKAIVIYGEAGGTSVNYGSTLIVTKVEEALDADDEAHTVITGYNMSGQTVMQNVAWDVDASAITPGDIITYNVDYKSEINLITMLFDREKDSEYTETRRIYNTTGDYTPAYTSNAQSYMTANVIADKEGNYIKTMVPGTVIDSIIRSEINLSNSQIYSLSDAVIYLYDSSSKDKVTKISSAELEEYVYYRNKDARAILLTTYSQLRAVYIYI